MVNDDTDVLIIGSGFGGAVSALRLADKGWRVLVAEQGRFIGVDDIQQGKRRLSKLMWAPRLGWSGYFAQHVFRHLAVIGGVGVGGGSLVWGAVMLRPKAQFFQALAQRFSGWDARGELTPCYDLAERMLGVTRSPHLGQQDEWLRQTADSMGCGHTFGPLRSAIYFGQAGVPQPDPFFGGDGPGRTGCCLCGGCMTGCPHQAKNSLDKNYLYLARQRGARIQAGWQADRIQPVAEGYEVSFVAPGGSRVLARVRARKVVLAAGVIGTLQLLFKNRDTWGTLPHVSPVLGQVVRTNSESITAVLHPPGVDVTTGPSISSSFHPDPHTHVTQNRFDQGYRFMRAYMTPLVDGASPMARAVRTLGAMLRHPSVVWRNLTASEWEKRISVFTVMQDHDNHLRMAWRRPWWRPWSQALMSRINPGHEAPSYLPVANEVARRFARLSGGVPLNMASESLLGLSTTAHVLGGCPMGSSPRDGVIDHQHEVFGHPGLYVVDGSSIPENIGVNPSLTIAAFAERFANLFPRRNPS